MYIFNTFGFRDVFKVEQRLESPGRPCRRRVQRPPHGRSKPAPWKMFQLCWDGFLPFLGWFFRNPPTRSQGLWDAPGIWSSGVRWGASQEQFAYFIIFQGVVSMIHYACIMPFSGPNCWFGINLILDMTRLIGSYDRWALVAAQIWLWIFPCSYASV